jgi:beta-lactamase regulating signal transducer with metallopeptidase domain
MKEIIISSSVLIGVLLLIRLLFRNLISRRVQYALWAIVLLRLLLPVNLPGSSFSVLNLGRDTQTAVTQTVAETASKTINQPMVQTNNAAPIQDTPESTVTSGVKTTADSAAHTAPAEKMTAFEVLSLVWKLGMGVMAIWVIAVNLIFWLQCHRKRVPFHVENVKRPVYLCANLKTPCLFGFFKPSIYITPAVAASQQSLRHVLVHEETHARHLDPLWSLLRCVCLTVYWFHPLVWVAASVSKTDCELACDEGALRRLGEEEKLPYGQTLLSLVPIQNTPCNPMLAATSMTAGERQLKNRITRIAGHRKPAVSALVAVLVLAMLLTACTFTGATKTATQTSAQSGQTEATGSSTASGVTLPNADPDVTISLTDLTPYEPEIVKTQELQNGARMLTDPVTVGDVTVFYCKDSSGVVWAAYQSTSGNQLYGIYQVDSNSSANLPTYTVKPFSNVLGYSGFAVSCLFSVESNPLNSDTIQGCRYYYFDDGGQLRQLAQIPDEEFSYQAVLGQLVPKAYPSWEAVDFGIYDTEKHSMAVGGYYSQSGVQAVRYVYFTGDALKLYKDTRTTKDHVMSGISVPDDVLTRAKDFAAGQLKTYQSDSPEAGYDDYRIKTLTTTSDYSSFDGLNLELYTLYYELHSATPANVVIAGGRYLTEDNWVNDEECYYMIFEVQDGKRTYLTSLGENDCSPGAIMFNSDLRYKLMEIGKLSLTDLSQEDLLEQFLGSSTLLLDQFAGLSDADKAAVCEKLVYYQSNGTDEQKGYFKDAVNSFNSWSTADLTKAEKSAYAYIQKHVAGA